MEFQIIDADYKLMDERDPVIRLFGRSDSGESVCCFVVGFEPYFYAQPRPGASVDSVMNSLKEQFAQIKKIELVERFEPVGYQTKPKKMFKITVFSPKNVPEIRDDVLLIPEIFQIYESDILFRNRYLIDKDIGGFLWVSAKDDPSLDRNHIIESLRTTCDVTICTRSVQVIDRISNAPLKYVAFDIECLPEGGNMPDPQKSPVILISFAFEPAFNGFKTLVLVGRPKPSPEIETDPDICWLSNENELLKRFFEIINEYDPDIMTGYNITSFDFPYIEERLEALSRNGVRIPSLFSRDRSKDKLRDKSDLWIRKFGLTVKAELTGRIIADTLPLVRRSYSLKQYTLRNVSKELLNMEKLDLPPAQMEEHWNDNGSKLLKFILYSRRDSELALSLLFNLKLLDKYIALSQITNSVIQEVISGGQTSMVEQLMTKEFNRRNRVMPIKPDDEEYDERDADEEGIKGGEVLDPVRGLHENVILLDYKSLYPTIMMAFNLCYTSVVETGTDLSSLDLTPDDVLETPSGGIFVKSSVFKGIVPTILEDLLNRRSETKKKMKSVTDEQELVSLDATQFALKILLNSYYGYSGYARARLYSMDLANSVTSIGRQNILNTKHLITDTVRLLFIYDNKAWLESELIAAGKNPFDKDVLLIRPTVIYGDTDSVFVHCGPDEGKEFPEGALSPESIALAGNKLAGIVTSSLPPPMELEFEAFARRVVLIAKKRYAQWLFEMSGDGQWSNKIKVKGMETVRRDWCELTSETQTRVLELVLKEGNVDSAVKHVRDVIDEIRTIDFNKNPEFIDSLILTKNYSKKSSSYRNKQPHATVVEKIYQRTGVDTPIGTRVPFVIISGKGLFADRAEEPEYVIKNNISIDVDYYINKQILPPVIRILEVVGVDETMLDGYQQTGLFDFGSGSKSVASVSSISENTQKELEYDTGPQKFNEIKEEVAESGPFHESSNNSFNQFISVKTPSGVIDTSQNISETKTNDEKPEKKGSGKGQISLFDF